MAGLKAGAVDDNTGLGGAASVGPARKEAGVHGAALGFSDAAPTAAAAGATAASMQNMRNTACQIKMKQVANLLLVQMLTQLKLASTPLQ